MWLVLIIIYCYWADVKELMVKMFGLALLNTIYLGLCCNFYPSKILIRIFALKFIVLGLVCLFFSRSLCLGYLWLVGPVGLAYVVFHFKSFIGTIYSQTPSVKS